MPQSERVGPTCRGSVLSNSSLEDIDSSCVVGAFIEATTGPNGCRVPLHTDINATCTTNTTIVSESGACLPCATSLAGIFHCINPPVEFQVNTVITLDAQILPKVTGLIGGGYVIVWRTLFDIYAKVYDIDNNPVTEFKVNSVSISVNNPVVTGLIGGGYVIAWSSSFVFLGPSQIVFRAYDANNIAVTAETLVSNGVSFNTDPSITGLINGSYVITWVERLFGLNTNILARVYKPDYTPVTVAPFPVSVVASSIDPDVAALKDGGYIIAWMTFFPSSVVYARRYNSAGTAAGPEFLVAPGRFPSIAGLLAGQYVISWSSSDDVFARVYDSNGIQAIPDYRVNSILSFPGSQDSLFLSVTTGLINGGYIHGWDQPDVSLDGVFAKVYDPDFNQFGNEFQLNSYTPLNQNRLSAAGSISGGYMFVWQSDGQDGSSSGIFAKAYDDAVIHQIPV